MDSVIVHYQEIALKGRNRPWFIERLVGNLRAATADLDVVSVRPLMGRLELALGPRADWEQVKSRIETTFGVANFAQARRAGTSVDELATSILDELSTRPDLTVETFRVSARRADKAYPLTSPEIEREVGGRIKAARGWKVDLTNP